MSEQSTFGEDEQIKFEYEPDWVTFMGTSKTKGGSKNHKSGHICL